MRYKKTAVFSAFVLAGFSVLFAACDFDISSVPTDVNASAENENLVDGIVTVYSRWYGADDKQLSDIVLSIYDGETEVYQGSGEDITYSVPSNRALTFSVSDSSGQTLAETDVMYSLSSDYDEYSVLAADEDSACRIIEIPADRPLICAAIFITDDKQISHANISEYTATEADTDEGGKTNEADTDKGGSGEEAGADAKDGE